MARVPKYGFHKASGQARVCIDGRQIYLGPHGSEESRAAYAREIDRWRLRQRGRSYANITVGEAILLFDEHAATYYVKNGKPTREIGLFKIAFRPLVAKYAKLPVVEFGPRDLKACRQFYVDADMVRNSANAHSRRIVRMFKWLVSEELCPPEVLTGLQAVPGLREGRSKAKESIPVRPVAMGDVTAVLPFVSRQVADMIRLQLLTGCRPGEIVQLRPCDVCRDGEVWTFRPATHKSQHHGRDRVVFIGPRGQAVLGPWLDNRPAESFCFSPAEAEAERRAKQRAERKTKVQPSQQNRRIDRPTHPPGEAYDTQTYGRAIRRGIKAANTARKEQGIDPVPAWSPNQLRHSRATDLRAMFDIEAARTVLGHSASAVTAIYAERDMEAARRIMAEVG